MENIAECDLSISIRCDKCPNVSFFFRREAVQKANEYGWKKQGHLILCPYCVKERLKGDTNGD